MGSQMLSLNFRKIELDGQDMYKEYRMRELWKKFLMERLVGGEEEGNLGKDGSMV